MNVIDMSDEVCVETYPFTGTEFVKNTILQSLDFPA